MTSPLLFLIAGIAVWRVTHLLHVERGPGDVFEKFRGLTQNSWIGKAMECFYCLSVWIAIPFSYWIGDSWKETLLLWPALSGLAILLERVTHKNLVQAQYYEEPAQESTQGEKNV